MAEVREFTLPDLGEGLTEAKITRWLVAAGDAVTVDQPVVEVETAKALVDVPCPYAGVVTARYGEEGAEIPVGTPLVTVATGSNGGSGGAAGTGAAVTGSDGSADDGQDSREDDGSGNVLVGYGTGSPRGRRRRVPPASTAATDAGTGSDAGTDDRTGADGAEGSGSTDGAERPVAVISPLVRRIARENGVDLRTVTGSGHDGLILRSDVERATGATGTRESAPGSESVAESVAESESGSGSGSGGAPAATPPVRPEAPASATSPVRIPLTGMRGTAADKLSRSRREIPDATCWVDADATELLAARRAMNAHGPGPAAVPGSPPTDRISLLALLARICTAALARFPELNATVDGKAREILRLPEVHLGFAAQTERGLVVPVVRDAHTLGAARLSAEVSRLTEAARAGTLTPAELTGGTFTLNNYGVFGVDGSTPILNHPEAAMLGVGRIAEKPWVADGELAVRHVVNLSFTFDHRVCDGGTAGGFLRYVADCVEQPAVLLRTL